MDFRDLLIAAFLVAGSCYVVYRSLWKKKGHCHGCSGSCGKRC